MNSLDPRVNRLPLVGTPGEISPKAPLDQLGTFEVFVQPKEGKPDENLKKNPDTGRWDYTEPDWEEFKRVINGDGPCNKERLEVRRIAEERGKWVRQALKKAQTKYTVPLA